MKTIFSLFAALSVLAVAQTSNPGRPSPKKPKPTLVPETTAAPAPTATSPATPGTTPPAASAEATPPTEGEAPEVTVGRFFAYLQRKEVDVAYDQLTKGTKIADRADDVKMLKSKTKDAIALFGAVAGFELVNRKTVGERLVSYTYVSLGKEFPLRWRFYFYKPQENWKLIDLRVDDRLSAIFDEPEEVRGRSEL